MDRSTRLEVLASVPVGRDPLGNTCCRVPAPLDRCEAMGLPQRGMFPFTWIQGERTYRPIPSQQRMALSQR